MLKAKFKDGHLPYVSGKDPMPVANFRTIYLILIILICFACGCEPSSKKQSHQRQALDGVTLDGGTAPGDRVQPGLTANAILASVVQRYEQAASYQDNGVLHLSYMLDGQRLDEPKRWATSYLEDGSLSLETFNTKLHGDGKVLACEIFDIETGNLDNQNLIVPYASDNAGAKRPPLDQVARDRIARHFVFGFSEVPLEPSYESLGPWLLPPAASLLTGQILNPWIQTPEQTARLADQVVAGKDCFVVRSFAKTLTADVWIDQKSLAIVQISLPLKLLADEVITSNEVSEVVLMAKFHDAVFDAKVSTEKFKFTPRDEAVFVRKLVSLPESLPCEKIGLPAPAFSLMTPDGEPRGLRSFEKQTTVLVWLSGLNSIRTALKLKPMLAASDEDITFGIVYSDSDTAQPGSGRPSPSSSVVELGRQLQVPIFYDRQHTASSKLQIKSVPAALVLDENSKVQYVQTLVGKDWLEKLTAAIQRVIKDEDVAAEMREAYAQYLDTYHQQVLSVSANSLIGQPASRSLGNVKPSPRSGRLEINPTRIWTSRDFKQPGNIVAIQGANPATAKFAVFDGVQTIGVIDAAGNLLKTSRPNLVRKDDSITKFRLVRSGEQSRLVVFSVMGENFLVLDENLNIFDASRTGQDADSRKRILDIQWDKNENPAAGLLVAWEDGGIERVAQSGQQKTMQLSEASFESLAVAGDIKVGVSSGNLVAVGSGQRLANSEIKFTGIAAGGDQFVGIGQNVHGKWSAIGFDKSFERLWALETGPHLHENFLTATSSSTTTAGERVWAIADSNQMIHLMAGSGQWLGEFQSENEISGLCVAQVGDEVRLLICSKRGVECWNLNIRNQ